MAGLIKVTGTKFKLGQVVTTQGVLSAFGGVPPIACLHRHAAGDWGDLDASDKALNDDAIAHEGNQEKMGRVLSVYTVNHTKIYIITEADRSVTTMLLPAEY